MQATRQDLQIWSVIARQEAERAYAAKRIAMHKVEGSSLIIRSSNGPPDGPFSWSPAGARRERAATMATAARWPSG
jgi:hypothetical protein